jgi:spore coat polysaccharide biosynthesis predicted glycosyltransferase SpsG
LKRVLFRLDVNKRLGMGHMSRCLDLSNKLRKYNINSYFLLKNNSYISKFDNELKSKIFTFSNSDYKNEISKIEELNNKKKFDCLVLDLKKLPGKNFFLQLKKKIKIVVIDNTEENSFLANLVIWPWVNEQYTKKISDQDNKKFLVGTKFMQLGYTTKKISKKKIPNSILISMGGSDKRNLTYKIVKSFKKSGAKFHLGIVIGDFFTDHNKILQIIKNDNRFSVIKNQRGVLSIMSEYKIGIFSFGITVCEAFYSGLPSIVLSHSYENDSYAKKIAVYDCMKYLGYYRRINFNNLPEETFSLMKNRKLYKKYSDNGQKMIDGKGSMRIAKRIKQLIK